VDTTGGVSDATLSSLQQLEGAAEETAADAADSAEKLAETQVPAEDVPTADALHVVGVAIRGHTSSSSSSSSGSGSGSFDEEGGGTDEAVGAVAAYILRTEGEAVLAAAEAEGVVDDMTAAWMPAMPATGEGRLMTALNLTWKKRFTV
jgi:hypothetical protein